MDPPTRERLQRAAVIAWFKSLTPWQRVQVRVFAWPAKTQSCIFVRSFRHALPCVFADCELFRAVERARAIYTRQMTDVRLSAGPDRRRCVLGRHGVGHGLEVSFSRNLHSLQFGSMSGLPLWGSLQWKQGRGKCVCFCWVACSHVRKGNRPHSGRKMLQLLSYYVDHT